METKHVIIQRRSCRHYKQLPIDDNMITTLLQAAYAAPVACGLYDCVRITVITNQQFLYDWDHACMPPFSTKEVHPLYGAPVQLLISARISENIPMGNPYINAGCIAENIALCATDLGLGSVLLAAPVRVLNKVESLLTKLELPPSFIPILSVAIGWPESQQEERTRPTHFVSTDWLC